MALPHLVTDSERKWVEKLIKDKDDLRDRDMCIWTFFICTPCRILELNRIQIGDVMTKKGDLKKRFVIRGENAFNGDDRVVLIKDSRFKNIILDCLLWIIGNGFNKGDHPDYYRGLDPLAPLFVTQDGCEFALTKTETTYKPDSLRRHIMDFMLEGGIENPSSKSGLRTFATALKRNNRHVSQINHLLGSKSLETTKRLVGNDPEDMGAIAADAF